MKTFQLPQFLAMRVHCQGVVKNLKLIDPTWTLMALFCPPPNDPEVQVDPLTEEEKITFARWIDLGAPITKQEGTKLVYR